MARINPDETRIWRVVNAVMDVFRGRTNSTGEFTCTAGATTTVVTDEIVSEGDWIGLMPTTANAAAEIGNGTIWIGTVAAGSFTVTHANAVSTDRTFRYDVKGE